MGFFDKNESPSEFRDIEAYFFNYDIPSNADLEPADKNPAPFLRQFAFHAQLSGWVVQKGDIPNALISRLIAAGCTVDLLKFDTCETDKLLAMAVRSIEEEITAKRRAAAVSYANAVEELQEDDVSADSALARFRRKNKAIIKRLTDHLDALQKCANRWNVSDRVPCLRSSVTGIAAMRQTMKVRAAAYATAIKEIEKREGRENFIAAAMRADAIPAGIAADYMDELGLNGQSLRSAFFE